MIGIRDADLAARLRRIAGGMLGNYPRLYYPVMRHRERYRELLIDQRTELVIEGYPRSGNTFAVAALQFAQLRPIAIARHTHYPAQVIEASRRRLPTLVLVREPRDAAASLVIREPVVSIAQALRRYVGYHRRIAPYQGAFVVGTFAEVTTNFGPVIDRLNHRFRLDLAPFDHTPAHCETVFQIVEEMERQAFRGVLAESRVARPSPARREPKARLLDELSRPAHRAVLADCDELFAWFQALADGGGLPLAPSDAAAS